MITINGVRYRPEDAPEQKAAPKPKNKAKSAPKDKEGSTRGRSASGSNGGRSSTVTSK